MRVFTQYSLATLALLASASVASAQATCGATNAGTPSCAPAGTQVTVTVEKIVRITVTPTEGNLTAPTDADFTAGGTVNLDNVDLQTITVRANVNWALTATASAWTAPYAKPITDASWSTTSAPPFTAFDGSAQSIATGGPTAGDDVLISYRVTWTLTTDEPGSYTLPVAFTLSSS